MDVIVEEGKDGPPDEYVVEAVINKRIFDGKLHYLIKWQGWPLEESTWEPVENCTKCDNLIQEYETELKKEADASARRMKTDESSSSSGPEVISDYETKRGSRRRKKKKKRKSNRNDEDFLVDDDDSDFGKRRKTRKRKIKKGNHESGYLSTDYLNGESTTTLDSDSSSSKSKKFKEQKDSVDHFSKKNRTTRENEAIKQILGSSGSVGASSRVRSREVSSTITSEDARSKRIDPSSSTCAKESETKARTVQNYSINKEEKVVQQHTIKDQQPFNQHVLKTVIEQLPNDVKPSIQPHHESLEQYSGQEDSVQYMNEVQDEKTNDPLTNSKPRRRISSSSSSEGENYERKYFGWERGKKITEVIDWYGYKDKVLHLVKYHDGEVEYVDDTYTCKIYPLLVFEMYNKQTSGQLDDDQRVWLSYAIQRFQEIEKNGPYDEETLCMNESDEESDNNHSGQENVSRRVESFGDSAIVVNNIEKQQDDEALGQSESSYNDNQNQPNFDENNFERDDEIALEVEEEEEEEVENDENNQNYHNSDCSSGSSGNSNRFQTNRNTNEETVDSELIVNTMDEESPSDQNDSVFIVHSDSSFSQTIPTNQPIVNPEFVIEDSDIEEDLLDSIDTVREAIYDPICNGHALSNESSRIDPEPADADSELPVFDPSPPSDNLHPIPESDQFSYSPTLATVDPPDGFPVNPTSPSFIEPPDINESDDGGGEPTEDDLQFDVSPPTSPYQYHYQ